LRVFWGQGYGLYSYALAWIFTLSVFAVMGGDKLIVRHAALYRTRKEWGLLKGLFRRTDQVVLIVSLALMTAVIVVARSFAENSEEGLQAAMIAGSVLLPIHAFIRLKQASLQGLERVVGGQVLRSSFNPSACLHAGCRSPVLFDFRYTGTLFRRGFGGNPCREFPDAAGGASA
jgi:uncharacterized membrane protein (UPF0136 family)